MGHSSERDIFFAAAGLLWGAVTLYNGLQRWRDEGKKYRSTAQATPSFLIAKSESPSIIIAGAGLSLGCLGYLVWSLWS